MSRYSFVGCNPRGIIRQDGDQVQVVEGGKVTATYTVSREPGEHCVRDGLEVVERVLGRYRAVDLPDCRSLPTARWVVGYEFIHDVEPVVPRPPRMSWARPRCISDRRRTAYVRSRAANGDHSRERYHRGGSKPEDAYDDAVEEVDRLVSLLEQPWNTGRFRLPPSHPRRRSNPTWKRTPSSPTSPRVRNISALATSFRWSARNVSPPR